MEGYGNAESEENIGKRALNFNIGLQRLAYGLEPLLIIIVVRMLLIHLTRHRRVIAEAEMPSTHHLTHV